MFEIKLITKKTEDYFINFNRWIEILFCFYLISYLKIPAHYLEMAYIILSKFS